MKELKKNQLVVEQCVEALLLVFQPDKANKIPNNVLIIQVSNFSFITLVVLIVLMLFASERT